MIDSIHERMRDAVAAAGDPVAKVRALVSLIFPSPSKNRAFFRAYVDFCGLAARRESFRQIGERFYAGCAEIDRGIVDEGIRRGAFRAARRGRNRFDRSRDLRRADAAVARGERSRRPRSRSTATAASASFCVTSFRRPRLLPRSRGGRREENGRILRPMTRGFVSFR